MVATVKVHEWNGISPGVVTIGITNINFGSKDAAELVAADYPIIAGQYSFEKWLKLVFNGNFNVIDNIKIWKESGVYKTNEGIQTNLISSGYLNATYTPGGPSENDSAIAINTLPVAEPGSANLGIGGSLTGYLVDEGSSDYLILQLMTTSYTEAGDTNRKSIKFQYDEQ